MITTRPLGVVPAAGAAKRFGGGKLLADIGGLPLLERTLRSRPFPIEVAEVRVAADPFTATARGAYIAAMFEK